MMRFLLMISLMMLQQSLLQAQHRVLVFSKTAGYRHASIVQGKAMFQEMAAPWKLRVDTTEDAGIFTPDGLKPYRLLVFLNTTGDILNEAQQQAMEAFIRQGGAFLGIHGAADTEYDWPFFLQLCGAQFHSHPEPQRLRYVVEDARHPAVSFWAPATTRLEEIYNLKNVQYSRIKLLLTADETSYQGGNMGAQHPAAWCHEYEGGRAFYTALGHHPETYADADFRRHIGGAIQWLLRKK